MDADPGRGAVQAVIRTRSTSGPLDDSDHECKTRSMAVAAIPLNRNRMKRGRIGTVTRASDESTAGRLPATPYRVDRKEALEHGSGWGAPWVSGDCRLVGAREQSRHGGHAHPSGDVRHQHL